MTDKDRLEHLLKELEWYRTVYTVFPNSLDVERVERLIEAQLWRGA